MLKSVWQTYMKWTVACFRNGFSYHNLHINNHVSGYVQNTFKLTSVTVTISEISFHLFHYFWVIFFSFGIKRPILQLRSRKWNCFTCIYVTSSGNTRLMEEKTVCSYISLFYMFIFNCAESKKRCFLLMAICDKMCTRRLTKPVLLVLHKPDFPRWRRSNICNNTHWMLVEFR